MVTLEFLALTFHVRIVAFLLIMTQQDKEILQRILDILESAEIDWICEFSAEKAWIKKQLKNID